MRFRRDILEPGFRAALARKAGLAALFVFLLVAFIGWNYRMGEADAAPVQSRAAAAAPAGPALRSGAVDSYADVVARVAPAVVTVRSERRARAVNMPFGDDSILNQLLPDLPRQQPREEGALGSGVIVRSDGYILTNAHVVDGAEQIQVDLTDGRTFSARLVGADKPSDLAVLKIDATNLPTVPVGNSDKVRVGDVVLAIGNPLGVGQTVTMGIISAKGRETGLTDGSYEDFLQTDAPINQGNSGGALVTAQGELIGINSQILTPSGGNIGIGFAIPVNMAENVMTQLIRNGRVERGLLGVTVQGINSDLAASLGLKDVHGALVSGVQPNSPASRAGLRRGDVITSIDGQPVTDSNSLRNHVASLRPGTKVALAVVRNGATETVDATLAELPEPRAVATSGTSRGDNGRFGMAVEPLTPALASQMHLKDSTGVLVDDVTPMGPAANAGIRSGDVIKEVDRKPVGSVADLQAALDAATNRPALLLVNRNGTDLFVAVSPRG